MLVWRVTLMTEEDMESYRIDDAGIDSYGID